MKIDPKVILRSVYLKKNELYSRENHAMTLNRLMSMGSFKFVVVRFADSDTTAEGYLDATILMTPVAHYTFRSELDLVTKSNDYSGPRLNVSLLDRNTFKGAELLLIGNDNNPQNLGQLNSSDKFMSNSLDAYFETVSGLKPSKILITAENDPQISSPTISEVILTTDFLELK